MADKGQNTKMNPNQAPTKQDVDRALAERILARLMPDVMSGVTVYETSDLVRTVHWQEQPDGAVLADSLIESGRTSTQFELS